MSEFSRFVSIDTETTGLVHEDCQVIEIGAVIDDWLTPLKSPPEFHCYIKRWNYKGHPYALSMHSEIFRRIAVEEEPYQYLFEQEAMLALGKFMEDNGAYQVDDKGKTLRANVAGKNYAMFDDRFIKAMSGSEHVKYKHRVIDPGNLFWEPLRDTGLPSSEECLERAGFDTEVSHTALEDAKMVAKLIHMYVGRTISSSALLRVAAARRMTQ